MTFPHDLWDNRGNVFEGFLKGHRVGKKTTAQVKLVHLILNPSRGSDKNVWKHNLDVETEQNWTIFPSRLFDF